ncbi:hypothetical protein EVAR_69984_1 [Eumeta japonica]|uniref:Uncharacterized protein n=1 Tax=Eumeta variegata TaxID=151549 RepID=A0A4C1ZEY9_EUMVA|nr:hypothetical protein EVAR_69984_1 [Eumeta japonica]
MCTCESVISSHKAVAALAIETNSHLCCVIDWHQNSHEAVPARIRALLEGCPPPSNIRSRPLQMVETTARPAGHACKLHVPRISGRSAWAGNYLLRFLKVLCSEFFSSVKSESVVLVQIVRRENRVALAPLPFILLHLTSACLA